MAGKLLFAELDTHFDVSFWFELERLKLGQWRLDTPTVTVTGTVAAPEAVVRANVPHKASVVALAAESFASDGNAAAAAPQGAVHSVAHKLVNHNTEEDLKGIDRSAVLRDAAAPIAAAITNGDFSSTSAAVGVVHTFADLKKHAFSCASGYPVIDAPAKASYTTDAPVAVDAALFDRCTAAVGHRCVPTLVVNNKNNTTAPLTRAAVEEETKAGGGVTVAMHDYASGDYPSWAWRNIITAVRAWAPGVAAMSLVCLRGSAETSKQFNIQIPTPEAAAGSIAAIASGEARVVGWASKLRRIDLGAMMDPTRLAESSARLNLGLMKWRMMPDIELDKVAATKALLLGAGTLGCNIARHLMMWGVNHITLVDRGTVSYSNPVRQTLFQLSDCTAEGENRVKSIAAANAIRRILPTCNATGVQLTIRMPGHAVDKVHEEEARRDVQQLEDLIKAHDVVFLLTDSRESRWLPTVLCTVHNKPVLNAALGFDSYVVMRHGQRSAPPETRCGCYFCNDVVAPMDSLTARTLDQQCTVTRPGVSAMASALSVELLAALFNHEKGFECPAYIASQEEETGTRSEARTVIGVVPHQIRGSVSDYGQMLMHGQSYEKCTACSPTVVKLYEEKGFEFILQCLNQPKYMEEVTGLAAERVALEEKYGGWDDDDISDASGEDGFVM